MNHSKKRHLSRSERSNGSTVVGARHRAPPSLLILAAPCHAYALNASPANPRPSRPCPANPRLAKPATPNQACPALPVLSASCPTAHSPACMSLPNRPQLWLVEPSPSVPADPVRAVPCPSTLRQTVPRLACLSTPGSNLNAPGLAPSSRACRHYPASLCCWLRFITAITSATSLKCLYLDSKVRISFKASSNNCARCSLLTKTLPILR